MYGMGIRERFQCPPVLIFMLAWMNRCFPRVPFVLVKTCFIKSLLNVLMMTWIVCSVTQHYWYCPSWLFLALCLLSPLAWIYVLLLNGAWTVPLNDKANIRQRSISLERDEPEEGLDGLEEPLRAKKRRESRQGSLL